MTNAQTTAARTVLVVEDEPLILMDTVDFLEDAGFVVLSATNADDALVVLESRDDVFALVTDVDMPGSMDGMDLAHTVCRRWPPMSIVVASGRLRPTLEELPVGGRFVAKPYGPSAVVAALAGVVPRERFLNA